MLEQARTPTIFAHRGASAYAPENTLAAIQLAVEQGADAIELDAKLSADGKIVVMHDQNVTRTTDGQGMVGEMRLAALRELDAGGWFDPRFAGEKIPTLEEVFVCCGTSLFINVELTNYASPGDALPEKVADLVEHHGLTERVLFSSFHPLVLRRAKRRLPGVPVGLLALPGPGGLLARWMPDILVPHQSLHPQAGSVTPSLLKRQHRRGRRVFAYTVNDEKDMRRLFTWGTDGIFTDDPPLALQIREGSG
jgi:glycerophosphoryl diester phosphodiesterase